MTVDSLTHSLPATGDNNPFNTSRNEDLPHALGPLTKTRQGACIVQSGIVILSLVSLDDRVENVGVRVAPQRPFNEERPSS